MPRGALTGSSVQLSEADVPAFVWSIGSIRQMVSWNESRSRPREACIKGERRDKENEGQSRKRLVIRRDSKTRSRRSNEGSQRFRLSLGLVQHRCRSRRITKQGSGGEKRSELVEVRSGPGWQKTGRRQRRNLGRRIEGKRVHRLAPVALADWRLEGSVGADPAARGPRGPRRAPVRVQVPVAAISVPVAQPPSAA